MPTYEYECRKCEHRFERFQNMTAPRVKTCPLCGGAVQRLFGAGAGVLVKGAAPGCNLRESGCPSGGECSSHCPMAGR